MNIVFLAEWSNYCLLGRVTSSGKGDVTDEFKGAVKEYTEDMGESIYYSIHS